MSQLVYGHKTQPTLLVQDLQVTRSQIQVPSSACSAMCYVCGKGLEDGHSLTAKPYPGRTVFFCDIHYSLK